MPREREPYLAFSNAPLTGNITDEPIRALGFRGRSNTVTTGGTEMNLSMVGR